MGEKFNSTIIKPWTKKAEGSNTVRAKGNVCRNDNTSIKPDTPINVYTRFCLNTAKSKFSLVSPVAD